MASRFPSLIRHRRVKTKEEQLRPGLQDQWFPAPYGSVSFLLPSIKPNSPQSYSYGCFVLAFCNVSICDIVCIISYNCRGCVHCSTMFCWEPEGRFFHWLCTAVAPFWFATDQRWIVILPFWLLIDGIHLRHASGTLRISPAHQDSDGTALWGKQHIL